MNTGQSLLTILAMVLLSVLILRVNNTFLTTGSVLVDSKYVIEATSLASSKLQQVCDLAFDENTVNSRATGYNDLTVSLNHESGETDESFYNDVDDYNNWHDTVYTVMEANKPAEKFLVKCKVDYVTSTIPIITSISPTWNKRVTVTVSNQFMPDTVKLSTIFSYWSFD